MDRRTDKRAAWLVILPALISVIAVTHHPVVRITKASSPTVAIDAINQVAMVNAAFHAVLLLLLGVQAVGLFTLAERLGLHRLRVRGGLVLFVAAMVSLFIAASFDGFLTPLIGATCVGAADQCGIPLAAALAVDAAAVQAFTKVGLGALALALCCWSIALPPMKARTALTITAAMLALAPLLWLGLVPQRIGPHELAILLLFEALWSTGAAILLWMGRLSAADARPSLA